MPGKRKEESGKFECRRYGLLAGKGVMGVLAGANYDIYDYLVDSCTRSEICF